MCQTSVICACRERIRAERCARPPPRARRRRTAEVVSITFVALSSRHGAEDLRYHVVAPAYEDPLADLDALSLDVVEFCSAWRAEWLRRRVRPESDAQRVNLPVRQPPSDLLYDGGRFLGKLVGPSPSRKLFCFAERLAQRKIVTLMTLPSIKSRACRRLRQVDLALESSAVRHYGYTG
jgi:hypothetical protein